MENDDYLVGPRRRAVTMILVQRFEPCVVLTNTTKPTVGASLLAKASCQLK
jgi:hypothetical protein